MYSTMFENALNHYKNQDELEEIISKENKSHIFVDDEGYHFIINNMNKVQPKDFFSRNDKDEHLNFIKKAYTNLLDLNELNKILKNIDQKIFLSTNEILIINEENDMRFYEEHLGSEVLIDCLGQSCHWTSSIIINMANIFKKANEMNLNKEDFFNTVVYQFYITLLHELGHNSLRYNLLPESYSPLFELTFNHDDEEDVVEEYAEYIFSYLDCKFNVFKPFNREFILSKYEI